MSPEVIRLFIMTLIRLPVMCRLAHIRRKFVDVQQSQGSAIAEEANKRITKLYGIEKEARGNCPEDRVAIR